MSPTGRKVPAALLGAHVSVAGGLATGFGRAAELGCEAIQIFVKNPNQWRQKPLGDDEAAAFRAAHAASGIRVVVAHASYLINLAAADGPIREQSLAALADELARAGALGVEGLVLHPGAHMGAGVEVGIERVAAALDLTLAALPAVRTRVLLENTAGQGSCLGHRLEQLAAIRALLATPERVGVCLDTCHAFAAGYAIHEAPGWREFRAEVKERIGETVVACWHVNDSLCAFGSRRDRHAHIGAGEIGLAAFRRLLAEPLGAAAGAPGAVPLILETDPEAEMAGHRSDLAALRRLQGKGKGRAAAAGRATLKSPAGGRAAGSSRGRTRSRPSSASK